MVSMKSLFTVMFLAAVLLTGRSPVSAVEGIISKVPDAPGSYCYLRFPAIREDTLYWDRPVLKDSSSGDIVSYYGSCTHDPLGQEEIRRQRADLPERRRRIPEGE